MKKLLSMLLVLLCLAATAQQKITIGTVIADTTALLQVNATNKGILVPRLTHAQMNAIVSPANGLLLYNTDSACFAYRNASVWAFLKGNTTASNDWSTSGNAGINDATNFIGTIENTALNFRVNNLNGGRIDPVLLNTFIGREAGNSTQTGVRNVAMGYLSLPNNTLGEKNSAIGSQSLRSNLSGSNNTAVGYDAMNNNMTGNRNTAYGVNALRTLSDGNENVAIGLSALYNNVSGIGNTAIGYEAGYDNAGSNNIFIGFKAGRSEIGSNKLYIQNSNASASNVLVYGEFDNKILSIGGKLGIGTTAPENIAHLRSANTDANASQLIIEGNSNYGDATYAAIEFRNNFASYWSGPAGRIKVSPSPLYTGNAITLQTTGPGPSFVDAMTLTDGRVGIGNPAPHGALQFANTLMNRKIVLFEDGNNDNQYNGFGINNAVMRYQVASATGNHVFYAGASATTSNELMRITGNGETGIGKIPFTTFNDSRLQVKQKGSQNGLGVEASNSTNHWDFYVTTDAASNFVLYYNGVNKGIIDNVTGAYTANSDRRLKKDISLQQPVLNTVMQLQAYQYHYLDNKSTDRFSNGFMAQDVQKLFPDAVVENTMKDGEKRLGINYQFFTVLAIKGMQEQQQQIQLQEERIAKLEAMIKTLAEKN